MNNQNTQVKVKFPLHLYEKLRAESRASGVTMASLVKLAVADRYKEQMEQGQAESAS